MFSRLMQGLACVAIAACGSAGEGPGITAIASATVIILPGAAAMGTAAFSTNPLVIKTGTVVTWINHDTMAHTATSASGVWDSGVIDPGASYSFTFSNSGIYAYYCSIHGAAAMSGTIEVHP